MVDEAELSVDALDFHTIRTAFKSLVAEGSLPESRWVDLAEQMVRDLTGSESVDPNLILWIISK